MALFFQWLIASLVNSRVAFGIVDTRLLASAEPLPVSPQLLT
jgi:hypothetical protein